MQGALISFAFTLYISTVNSSVLKAQLDPRADCRTITVVSGDSCGALATKCGISAAQFTTFNPSSTLCSTLQIGQRVCCSAGTLPNLTPKQNANGTCFVYKVAPGDFCAAIATAHGTVTVAQIETYNTKTWGWTGCAGLQAGAAICLSTGTPPMPAPVDSAICGPQVPGTKPPAAGISLASLNPCPLNACCDIWGQCGTTLEFCTISTSITGAPGTAAPGANGCISNCGVNIINVSPPVNQFMRIGYYEGWIGSRSCLNMDVSDINLLGASDYTHVHFAFGSITTDFKVAIGPDVAAQFNKFVAVPQGSFKKILSFGGWSFSTDVDSFPIFRTGVTSANRQTFANNVVAFIVGNGLDGVDFDWEYPGAPDIPGIPPGSPTDGANYLEFLKMVRAALPAGKTVSIAAPASYWYLKGFPIAEMAAVVDYIIYMTYDLHGQWDYGNTFSNSGCANGNCLRSHVNFTETLDALSMITKAGVTTNKIAVGVASYGRSFKGTTAGCTGPTCTFVGPDSGATAGPCTAEPGYISNAEINAIIATNPTSKAFYDSASNSNILLYNSVQWVAYMDNSEKARRIAAFKGGNFAGTSDWAIDLATFKNAAACPASIPDCDILQYSTIGQSGVNWRTINCTNQWITTTDQNPMLRWYGIGADGAWTDALNHYNDHRQGSSLSFTEAISDFFHGPGAMDCQKTSAFDGCVGNDLQCHDTVGADSGPAGYFILNSFIHIEQLLEAFYTGVTNAHGPLADQLGGFTSTFAPVKVEPDFFKIALDIFGLGFALTAAPIWNSVLRDLPYFKLNPKALGTLKDSVNAFVSNSITIIKDSSVASESINRLNTVAETLAQLTEGYFKTIDLTNQNIFDGSNTDLLSSMIKDGVFLMSTVPTDLDIQAIIFKSMFAILIPFAWGLADDGVFILDPGIACGAALPNDIHITPTGASLTGACVGNKQYYIAGISGASRSCDSFVCSDNSFALVPGLSSLDGKNWGGVTLNHIITGGVNSFAANGNKNGGTLADASNTDTLSAIQDADITAPGINNIPVCSDAEAFGNWQTKELTGNKTPNFPCN